MENKSAKPILRLRSRASFQATFSSGKKITATPWLVANFTKNENAALRVGWTVPGYIGTAVTRNRLKRWMREFLKTLPKNVCDAGLDVNLVLRRKELQFYRELEHEDLNAALAETFKRLEQRAKTS